MKPAPFEYIAPRSLPEAIEALRESGGDAKVLAGGQSLLPLLNMRLASPSRLVDINRVPELAYVVERDGGFAVGATTRATAVEREAAVAQHIPMLTQAIGWVGHRAIRNRTTIGGSLAHADPAAELPAVAVCLDATITATGPGGVRHIPARDFFAGYLTTTLEPDEILTESWWPKTPARTGQAWLEFARRHGDFALAGVGVSLTLDADGDVADARMALTGVGGTPFRALEAEALLIGGPIDEERVEAAAAAVRSSVTPDADIHGSTEYRAHLAGVLTERAIRTAHSRAAEGDGEALDVRRTLDWLGRLAELNVVVNGRAYHRVVEPRLLLSDFLRHEIRLTGTHVGCEHGVCGACTVLVDGETARACLMLAIQADGCSITTVEGLAQSATELHPVQQAFWDTHALQCGFCTAGFLITTVALLQENPRPTAREVREALSGNLCRCTGYQNIVRAVLLAAERMA